MIKCKQREELHSRGHQIWGFIDRRDEWRLFQAEKGLERAEKGWFALNKDRPFWRGALMKEGDVFVELALGKSSWV